MKNEKLLENEEYLKLLENQHALENLSLSFKSTRDIQIRMEQYEKEILLSNYLINVEAARFVFEKGLNDKTFDSEVKVFNAFISSHIVKNNEKQTLGRIFPKAGRKAFVEVTWEDIEKVEDKNLTLSQKIDFCRKQVSERYTKFSNHMDNLLKKSEEKSLSI